MFKYGVFSGPHFPAFGLNTEILRKSPYSVRMRKIRTRKNSVFVHFSRSGSYKHINLRKLKNIVRSKYYPEDISKEGKRTNFRKSC